MKSVITITVTVVLFGTALLVAEQHRKSGYAARSDDPAAIPGAASQAVVRAPGRIEGQTREIELRAQIAEQIHEVYVNKGQWVSVGQPLLSLDASRLTSERDLAAALLAEAEARKERLENGFRSSEIESARQEYEAMKAKLDGAEKSYQRTVKLARNDAVSRQTLDDRLTMVKSMRGTTAAARFRLETLEAPPRNDDLLIAAAGVRAAQARLRIAQINLDRAQIKAPVDGKILALEAKVGELTGPTSEQPLLLMSDTSRLRVVAEVDEYDALRIRTGQTCQITADSSEGLLARGKIVEVEPHMRPKRMFGQWAGERNDTYARRVRIELENRDDLPVGLPVDVAIEIGQSK